MGQKYDMGTCLSCGTTRKVLHREWIRAARPRCLACGGALEASHRASGEHAKHEAGKAERQPSRNP
jgi:hypothetical protein